MAFHTDAQILARKLFIFFKLKIPNLIVGWFLHGQGQDNIILLPIVYCV